jgi:hypothetical protein
LFVLQLIDAVHEIVPFDDLVSSLPRSGNEEVLSIIVRPHKKHAPVMAQVLRDLDANVERQGSSEWLGQRHVFNVEVIYNDYSQAN